MKEDKLAHASNDSHHLVLVIKSWEKEIPTDWRNIIIAKALNYCIYNESLVIKGYLLTKKRLCLIVISESHSIRHILNVFAKEVVKGIYNYENNFGKYLEESRTFNELFIQYPLYNPYIIKLITGKKIILPYNNPHVTRLEKRIHDYNYCSAIDYSGAIGPVIVQTH